MDAQRSGTLDGLSQRRWLSWGAVIAGALALALQVVAIREQSLIGDAPYHLLAGHQSLRHGLNTINLEHPPLVKALAALPLLAEEPLAPPVRMGQAIPTALEIFERPDLLRRVQLRSRTVLLLLFALPFLLTCLLLGREVASWRAGALLAIVVGLSFNVVPYLSVLQTDTAVGLAFALTALAAIRFSRQPSIARALWLGAGWGLAVAVKFSGLLLAPAIAVSLLLARLAWRRRLGYAALVGALTLGLVYATYSAANWSYDSDAGRRSIRQYCRDEGALEDEVLLRPWESTLLGIERWSPPVAQWLVGFLSVRRNNALGVYPTQAFGQFYVGGRWWYFPAVLLVKTPLVLLGCTVLAGAGFLRRLRSSDQEADRTPSSWPAVAILSTITVTYLAVAMTSNYNLGMRHLLPIVPYLFLPAVLWAARKPLRCALLTALLATEALALSPLWMSATNTWFLADANPTRLALSNSNFESNQNFLALRRYVERHELEPVYVLHPWIGETALAAYLPKAKLVGLEEGVVDSDGRVRPGWYAVNAAIEQYVPAVLRREPSSLGRYEPWYGLALQWQPLWQAVASQEDHGYIAGTFHLYHASR